MPRVEWRTLVEGRWDATINRLVFQTGLVPDGLMLPDDTMLLVLMANGRYAGMDPGPAAGDYSGLATFGGNLMFPMTTTDTTVYIRLFGPEASRISDWPIPALPFAMTINDPTNVEPVTVTALDYDSNSLTVTRTLAVSHPADVDITGSNTLVDAGNAPPLLYTPGDPTQAPILTPSYWAMVKGATTDRTFGDFDSRYWQSAPSSHTPIQHTLAMVARRVTGDEWDLGLLDPGGVLRVELQGALPSSYAFRYSGRLVVLAPTVQILPLPDYSSDIIQQPRTYTAGDPHYPPFNVVYPMPGAWTEWVSSTGMDNVDLWLPIMVSSYRGTGLYDWHDRTGVDYDPANPDSLYDNPVNTVEFRQTLGSYVVNHQLAQSSYFNVTHDPNPIVDEILHDQPVLAREPAVWSHPWWELSPKTGLFVGADAGDALEVPVPFQLGPPPGGGGARPIEFIAWGGDVLLLVVESAGTSAPTTPSGWTRIDALSGPNTLATTTSEDQWVGVYWKVAAGPATDAEGSPVVTTDTSPAVLTFSDARSAGIMYAVTADQSNPWSVMEGGSAPSYTRTDYAAPAAFISATDFTPQDACTQRLAIGLFIGHRTLLPVPPLPEPSPQPPSPFPDPPVGPSFPVPTDLTVDEMFTEFDTGGASDDLPAFQSDTYPLDGPAVVLYLGFRARRPRPTYPLVSGHYAPSFANRGALPPCTGAFIHFTSGDLRNGFGLGEAPFFPPPLGGTVPPPVILFERTNVLGDLAYWHAWLFSEDGNIGGGYQATYSQPDESGDPGVETVWFNLSSLGAMLDWYAPPAPSIIGTDLRPITVRLRWSRPYTIIGDGMGGFITLITTSGKYGTLVWSEEDCQPLGEAVYGLAAGFRYRAEARISASNQQPSIVG